MPLDYICIISDETNRPCYEKLGGGEERLLFVDIAEAAESVGSCGISVMILDSGYSPHVGLSLLKRIKKCCVSVPIIFLTDISSESIAIGAFKAGAREYFKKPVDPGELWVTITNLASLKRTAIDTRSSHTIICPETGDSGSILMKSNLPDVIQKSVRFLNENISDKIYLEKVASFAGMSKFHLCRTFKNYLGMTPMQFLTINRIEMAKKLIKKTGESITSVIYKVGFNDISEFNRQFKKITGQTPSSFKKSQKNQESEPISG